MFDLARCSNLARLSCRVSVSRAYSTRPNRAIIDLLQRCASCVGRRRGRVCLLIVLQVSKKRTQVQHAMRTKCALSRSQSRPFTDTANPFALGKRPSRYALVLSLLSTPLVTLPLSVTRYRPRHCQPNRLFPPGQRICL